MINVVYSALTGLIVSMFAAANGYNSPLLHASLAFAASIPFAVLLYKERNTNKGVSSDNK